MGYRALSRLIYRKRLKEYDERRWELFLAMMSHTPQTKEAATRQQNAAKRVMRSMRKELNIMRESLRRKGIIRG